MNIDIEKTLAFSSVLVIQDRDPCINEYVVRLRLHVECQDNHEYNIAYLRIKHWFHEIMQDSVLIESQDPRLQAWRSVDIRCMDFPVAPQDQSLSLMLMSKLSAITEDRITISQVAISSPRDDDVVYVCDQGDGLHWFDEVGWWQDPGPVHATDVRRGRKSLKVISMPRTQDWAQHGLDWSDSTDDDTVTATITPFVKNEEK
jgi:hypothetical protein